MSSLLKGEYINMNNIIKKLPIPICGLALGLAALGNLLQSYSETVRYICGIASGIIIISFLLKCILYTDMIKEDMKNPIMASVFGTFPMALMLLSVYVKPWINTSAKYLWLIAILIHGALIVYFTLKFMIKPQLPKVFASYFIVYVGIVVASVTAPAYEMLWLGNAFFWFGFITLIGLLVLVTLRYIKHPAAPEPARPLICIYAAPISLCIVGYVQSVTPKAFGFLIAMYGAACIAYVFSLIKAIGYVKLPFYPSYAAFTFPFVISALASKQTMACAAKLGNPLPILKYVVLVETIIAVAAVSYTLIRYMMFIFMSPKAKKEQSAASA